MRLPRKLISNTHEAECINDIIDYLRSLTPQSSSTTRVTHGLHGVQVEAMVQAVSGNAVRQFKLVATGQKDFGDYYACNTWDGTNLGTAVVYVAKQFKMLCILPSASPAGGAITSETIRGGTYNYSYAYDATYDEYVRTTTGAASTTDYITPPALAGNIIYAIPFATSAPATLANVHWIELTERKWASG